jgi:hypothetical protein
MSRRGNRKKPQAVHFGSVDICKSQIIPFFWSAPTLDYFVLIVERNLPQVEKKHRVRKKWFSLEFNYQLLFTTGCPLLRSLTKDEWSKLSGPASVSFFETIQQQLSQTR